MNIEERKNYVKELMETMKESQKNFRISKWNL